MNILWKAGSVFGLLALACAPYAQSQDKSPTLVAGALSWYGVWMTPDGSAWKIQTCVGKLRRRGYSLTCNPLDVDVDIAINGAGDCSIEFMQPHFDLGEKHRATLSPGTRHAQSPERFRCGGLPTRGGPFALLVQLHPRIMDEVLSRQARDQALAYFKRARMPPCVIRLPKVSAGDPFFDVYQECKGVLQAVWEFPIRRGKPLDYAQWTYTRRRGTLPVGAEERCKNPDLWFDVVDLAKELKQ